jgi:hypothetical protein
MVRAPSVAPETRLVRYSRGRSVPRGSEWPLELAWNRPRPIPDQRRDENDHEHQEEQRDETTYDAPPSRAAPVPVRDHAPPARSFRMRCNSSAVISPRANRSSARRIRERPDLVTGFSPTPSAVGARGSFAWGWLAVVFDIYRIAPASAGGHCRPNIVAIGRGPELESIARFLAVPCQLARLPS